MKKKFILYLLPLLLLLSACSKDSDNNDLEENSWTFTEGSNVYSGSFLFGHATLNTTLQSNNTYTFAMLGVEKKFRLSF